MNQLLFDRSSGNVRASKFTRAVLSQRIHSFQLAPGIRFNGGEKEVQPADAGLSAQSAEDATKIWAHQAGVNALAIDIDNSLLISGGADSSIKLWHLQDHTTGFKHIFKPAGIAPRYVSGHKRRIAIYPLIFLGPSRRINLA